MFIQLIKETDNYICNDIGDNQFCLAMHILHQIALGYRDYILYIILLQIFFHDFQHRVIIIHSLNICCPQLSRDNGENARSGAHIKDSHARLYQLLQLTDAHRRGGMGACAKGCSWIQLYDNLIILWLIFLPGRLDNHSFSWLFCMEILLPGV